MLGTSADIHVVDIDLVLQPKENVDPTSSTLQQKDATVSGSILITSAYELQVDSEQELNKTMHTGCSMFALRFISSSTASIYFFTCSYGMPRYSYKEHNYFFYLAGTRRQSSNIANIGKDFTTISRSSIFSHFSTRYGNFSIKHYQQGDSKIFSC